MFEAKIPIVQFLNRTAALFLAPIFLLCPIFMISKAQRYAPISQSQADQIIAWVKPLWPVVELQYAGAEKADSTGARLYALMSIISLIMVIVFFVYSILKFYAARRRIQTPGTSEYVMSVLAPLLYVLFAFFDTPTERYQAGFFWVDDFGIYYFREYVVFVGIGIAVLVCLLTIIKIAGQVVGAENADDIK
jgi:hypothetical protein